PFSPSSVDLRPPPCVSATAAQARLHPCSSDTHPLLVIRPFAFLVLLLALAGCGGPSAADLHGTLLDPPMPGAGFRLTSADRPVQSEDFHGRFVVLAFGYTSCPDVCPATLARLAHAMDLLGESAREVQVVFVSVDPERDDPQRAARFAAAFDERFVGASGSPEAIADVA